MTACDEPTFRVRNRMFETCASADNHHGAGRHAVWCGISLEADVDWADVAVRLREANRLVAPKRPLASLDDRRPDGPLDAGAGRREGTRSDMRHPLDTLVHRWPSSH